MKKIYKSFCKLEEFITLILLAGLTLLVFLSALFRTFKHPLNWAQDVALVAFAWLIFLGSDVAVRGPGLIGVDILIRKFPKGLQKALDIIFKCIILVFLGILAYYGLRMTIDGWERKIAALNISYSYVTLAVPVGSFLMMISIIIKLIERIKTKASDEIEKIEGRDVV